MRRSIVAILVMGILSVAALGLGASYLFDQSPEIRSVTRFKTDALEDLSLSAIGVRIFAREDGKVALVTAHPEAVPADAEGAERLALDLAERFVAASGEHLSADIVQVDVADEARWGCRDAETLYAFAWHMGSLRSQALFRRGLDDLSAALDREHPALGASIRGDDADGRRWVIVTLPGAGDLDETTLRSVAALARTTFSRSPFREIRFVDETGGVRWRFSFYGKRIEGDAQ
ncbi:MAG: hypothetical protein JXP34_15085 [Planctomycetes bacterium]|nr:hypothetical protein [Planctomycetota bacterium]